MGKKRLYLKDAGKMTEVRPFKEEVEKQCLRMVVCLDQKKAYGEEGVMILLERSRGAEKRKGPGKGQGVTLFGIVEMKCDQSQLRFSKRRLERRNQIPWKPVSHPTHLPYWSLNQNAKILRKRNAGSLFPYLPTDVSITSIVALPQGCPGLTQTSPFSRAH